MWVEAKTIHSARSLPNFLYLHLNSETPSLSFILSAQKEYFLKIYDIAMGAVFSSAANLVYPFPDFTYSSHP